MYEYFGGVPIKTTCDNLKTGVIKYPKEGEIILNESYEVLGNHYMTAIMPTGVRKPKQKAAVEGIIRFHLLVMVGLLRLFFLIFLICHFLSFVLQFVPILPLLPLFIFRKKKVS